MFTISSSDLQKDWSNVMDSVVKRRPAFIRRTRDRMVLSSVDTIRDLVANIRYLADEYCEDDGTVTLSLCDMDIIANGADIVSAKRQLAENIMEYAEEYYASYELYHSSPNRKAHLPYVMKALTAKNLEELEGAVLCRHGES